MLMCCQNKMSYYFIYHKPIKSYFNDEGKHFNKFPVFSCLFFPTAYSLSYTRNYYSLLSHFALSFLFSELSAVTVSIRSIQIKVQKVHHNLKERRIFYCFAHTCDMVDDTLKRSLSSINLSAQVNCQCS